MIVLITENIYLRAEKVQSISVNEHVIFDNEDGYTRPVKGSKTWTIHIHYEPPASANGTPNPYHGPLQVNISANNRKHCNDTMKSLIEQVREQDPDNKMIDKLIEKYFCGEVKEDDGRTEKIRRVRKKKRRSKKVLRRS